MKKDYFRDAGAHAMISFPILKYNIFLSICGKVVFIWVSYLQIW